MGKKIYVVSYSYPYEGNTEPLAAFTTRKAADAYSEEHRTLGDKEITELKLAGHRANKLTRAERAVVDAAETWRIAPVGDKASERKLLDACERLAYERAKGGAR
jgi:hypothetical protein